MLFVNCCSHNKPAKAMLGCRRERTGRVWTRQDRSNALQVSSIGDPRYGRPDAMSRFINLCPRRETIPGRLRPLHYQRAKRGRYR
jgi:hypothetical protein